LQKTRAKEEREARKRDVKAGKVPPREQIQTSGLSKSTGPMTKRIMDGQATATGASDRFSSTEANTGSIIHFSLPGPGQYSIPTEFGKKHKPAAYQNFDSTAPRFQDDAKKLPGTRIETIGPGTYEQTEEIK
jgi:hypothetical protein